MARSRLTRGGFRAFALSLGLVVAACEPDQPEPDSAALWIAHGEQLRQYSEAGPFDAKQKYREAATAFRQALAIEPANPEASFGLASVLMRVGETEAAAETLVAALESSPQNAKLHAKMGYALRYAGYLEASVDAYKRSMELDDDLDNQISGNDQIAKALLYGAHADEALMVFETIRALHRTLDSLPLEKTVFYEGLAYLYLGDQVQAHARFRESIGLSPGTLWAQFAEAYDDLAAGDQKALGALAARLESENVSDGERRYRLVHFFATLGDKDRAIMHFDAAVEAGNFNYPYFAHDRLLDPLRGEDRFTTILNKTKKRHENFPYRYMDPNKEQPE